MRRFCNDSKEEQRIDKLDHRSVQDSDLPALHKILVHTMDDGLKIFLVDGNAVRNQFNPDFTKGGHGLAYKFIPKDEIWIENVGGPQEMKDILAHELYEHLEIDGLGAEYQKAHGDATQVEDALREFDKIPARLAVGTARLKFLLAKSDKSSKPKKVTEIADSIQRDNPEISESVAHRMAWETYCSYVNPSYEGCTSKGKSHRESPKSEYGK